MKNATYPLALLALLSFAAGCPTRFVGDDAGGVRPSIEGGAGAGQGKGGNAGANAGNAAGRGSGGSGAGAYCVSSVDCGSGQFCVENVCCNSACNTKCNSCLQANTGHPDGICDFVRAGTSHGMDCATADVSTCGNDGTCDGAGACRKYQSGRICKAASCPQGSSTATAASVCDGSGDCVAGSSSSCGNYACIASTATCGTTCSVSADCASGDYCDGGACAPKKAAGAVCSANPECASGTCGGRCCDSGTNCSCPQPSAANRIKNPGFDADSSNWTIIPGDGSITWGNADATSCPYSGSIYITSTETATSPRISQCIPVSPSQSAFTTPYYWALRTKGAIGCDIESFASPNCTGSSTLLSTGVLWVNDGWSGSTPTGSVAVGLEASSVRFSCYVPPDYPSASGYVDKFYFSSTSGNF